MTVWSRLEKSMLAGAVTGVAVTLHEVTRRPALAAAARPGGPAGAEHAYASFVLSVFTATTLITGLAVFTLVSLAAARRARHRGSGYGSGGYGGGAGGGWW